mgnify:CR=1 FL=1
MSRRVLVLAALVLGEYVDLVNPASVQDTDRYDRLLRYIDLGDTDAGQTLLGAGLAVARYDVGDRFKRAWDKELHGEQWARLAALIEEFFYIEFYRVPDAHLGYLSQGWVTMGQMLTAPMIIAGAIMLVSASADGEQGNGAVLRVVLWGLAILTNITVLQRILWVYLNTRPEGIAVGNAVWRMPDWLKRKLDKNES